MHTILYTEPSSCNLSPELCSLRFNQVSLAGSHNSGSGFDGSLRQCSGAAEGDCIWRNQNLNITAQLDLGIRFLEIDLCILPDHCDSSVYDYPTNSSLFVCRYAINSGSERYAGPINKLLQQVHDWMLGNPYDVIGLYFPLHERNRTQIFPKLLATLENLWLCNDGSSSSVCMSTYYNTYGEWPTLEQAIMTGQRIFVFINTETTDPATLWNHRSFHSTYIEPTGRSLLCEEPLSADRCNTAADILIEAGVTSGTCIRNGQDNCNMLLTNATLNCYKLRRGMDQTVNVVAVDFPELESSTVFLVVGELNKQNIAQYSSPTTALTDPTMTVSTNTTTENGAAAIASTLYITLLATLLFVLVL